jgi:hypothetical protein
MPIANSEFSAAVVGRLVYLVGGFRIENAQRLLVHDVAAGTWRAGADAQEPMDTAAARTRIDLATKTPEGRLKFIECKNGPCAGLTRIREQRSPKSRTKEALQREATLPRLA